MIALPFLVLGSRRRFTVTFNSSQSFVIPPGVTELLAASGKGADGYYAWGSTSTAFTVAKISFFSTTGGNLGSTLTYETVGANGDDYLAALNAGGSGERSISAANASSYQWDATAGQWRELTTAGVSTGVYKGTAVQTGTSWALTGTITTPVTAGTAKDYQGNGLQKKTAMVGASTTGFDLTFTGGAGANPASVQTFNNSAVTPGQSYSLSIASGGYITITYEGY